MYVRFFIRADCSDVYEVSDDITEEELEEQAGDWFNNNVYADWEIVEDYEI